MCKSAFSYHWDQSNLAIAMLLTLSCSGGTNSNTTGKSKEGGILKVAYFCFHWRKLYYVVLFFCSVCYWYPHEGLVTKSQHLTCYCWFLFCPWAQSRTHAHKQKGFQFPEEDSLKNEVAKEAHFIQGSWLISCVSLTCASSSPEYKTQVYSDMDCFTRSPEKDTSRRSVLS